MKSGKIQCRKSLFCIYFFHSWRPRQMVQKATWANEPKVEKRLREFWVIISRSRLNGEEGQNSFEAGQIYGLTRLGNWYICYDFFHEVQEQKCVLLKSHTKMRNREKRITNEGQHSRGNTFPFRAGEGRKEDKKTAKPSFFPLKVLFPPAPKKCWPLNDFAHGIRFSQKGRDDMVTGFLKPVQHADWRQKFISFSTWDGCSWPGGS